MSVLSQKKKAKKKKKKLIIVHKQVGLYICLVQPVYVVLIRIAQMVTVDNPITTD